MGTKEFYDEVSPIYYRETFDGVHSLTSLGRSMRTQRVLEMMSRHLHPGAVVADLGCGPAQFAEPLLKRAGKYIGIDISPEMFSRTATRLSANPRVSFLEGSVEEIPLPAESIDAVLCIGVLEYLPTSTQALREIHRTLKKSGVAIISFPSLWFPMFYLRAALRPLVAPILRRVIPQLRQTVYVSEITHRIMSPGRFIREAKQVSFRVSEKVSHGFFPVLFNHRLSQSTLTIYTKLERLGERVAPGMGANFIVCLEK
jgi:ubiquinone/menaquinone biosynthesis C-methylase UbiE